MLLVSFWENVWNGITTFFKKIGDFFMSENQYGINVLTRILIAIAVLVVGVILIKLFIGLLKRISGVKKGISLDISAKSFFISLLKIILYFALAFSIVAILGVDISGAVGILSAVTVALGLALQDIIAMFASGLLIFQTKNFHTNDHIKVCNSFGTEEGKVLKISLLYTVLLTFDGQKVYIPNNNITKANVTNFSDYKHRRGAVSIVLTYDSDPKEVLKVFQELVDTEDNALKDPAGQAFISDFKDYGVEYTLRVYTALDNYWGAIWSIRERVLLTIKEHGFKVATSTSLTVKDDKEEIIDK